MTAPWAKKFVLRDASTRERLVQYAYELPLENFPNGVKVVFSENKDAKTQEQVDKYHAMIRDIKKSGKFRFMDRTDWSEEDIKRILIDAFARVMTSMGTPLKYQPRIVPSLDGSGVVYLGVPSRGFDKKEASDFIEFLYAYGADLGVRWTTS